MIFFIKKGVEIVILDIDRARYMMLLEFMRMPKIHYRISSATISLQT